MSVLVLLNLLNKLRYDARPRQALHHFFHSEFIKFDSMETQWLDSMSHLMLKLLM